MFRFTLTVLVWSFLGAAALGQAADRPAPKKLPPALAQWLKSTPEEILKRHDKDGDGYLSRQEVPPFLRPSFDKADLNGDGKLDRKEIARVLQGLRRRFGQGARLPPADSPEVQKVLRNLLQQDTDGDGKVSRSEARGRLAANFDRFDTNKDSYLDRSELLRVARLTVAYRQKAKGAPAKAKGPREVLDFDALDRNADGRLTRDEVRGTTLAPLFDQIDTNHDGRIDPEEFDAFLKKRQASKKEKR
jgi:Ca2+-binding EF-hand superfamily protein